MRQQDNRKGGELRRGTKGCGSRSTSTTLAMVFKLAEQAQKHWLRLNNHQLLLYLVKGVKFVDSVMQKEKGA